MTSLISVSLVAIGGAIGSVLRYAMMNFVGKAAGINFPYGTLAVNVTGSLLMGILIGALARFIDGGSELRLFLAVGVLGGFTTFSAFSLDVVTMIENNNISGAAIYVISSVLFSIIALFLGLVVTRIIL